MKNFVQPGVTLPLLAPYAVLSGGGFKVGGIVAIAHTDAANGAAVEGQTQGVFDVTTDTGAAWAVGDVIYWDNTNKRFTATVGTNTKAGVATAIKQTGDVVGRVKLIPSI